MRVAWIWLFVATVQLVCAPGAASQRWADFPAPLFELVTGLDRPVALANAADGSRRLFVAERSGRILAWDTVARYLDPVPFLDLSARIDPNAEEGIIAVAFHPRFGSGMSDVYVSYVRGIDGNLVVARYRAYGDGLSRADSEGETILLTLSQAGPGAPGGGMAFGPDGYLYVGIGDGGGGDDPYRRAQDPRSLYGKLLRLDVDAAPGPYAIPRGNPYASGLAGRPEVWALGMHDPRQLATYEGLNVLDLGRSRRDELNLASGYPTPANYGWPVVEGSICTGIAGPIECTDSTLWPATIEFDRDAACPLSSFVRGYTGIPSALGKILFASGCAGTVWVRESTPGKSTRRALFDAGFRIGAMGVDENRDTYVTDLEGGRLLRLVVYSVAQTTRMIEYRHEGLDHYFVTSNPAEIAALDAGAFEGWQRTGLGFNVYADLGEANSSCRFYLPPSLGNSHFYSASPAECEAVIAGMPGAVLETRRAMSFTFPDSSTGACEYAGLEQPLYRVWNGRADVNHRYTTDRTVRDAMVAAGGVAEGSGADAVTMCMPKYECNAPACPQPP